MPELKPADIIVGAVKKEAFALARIIVDAIEVSMTGDLPADRKVIYIANQKPSTKPDVKTVSTDIDSAATKNGAQSNTVDPVQTGARNANSNQKLEI